MVPPSTIVAMPCLTAFSISGCSTSGGTRQSAQASIQKHFHLKPRAEANLLDIEIGLRQIQFLMPGDAFALAQAQRIAEEIGEADTHFACTVRDRKSSAL